MLYIIYFILKPLFCVHVPLIKLFNVIPCITLCKSRQLIITMEGAKRADVFFFSEMNLDVLLDCFYHQMSCSAFSAGYTILSTD